MQNPEEKKYVSSGIHGDLDQPAKREAQLKVGENADAESDEESKEQEKNELAMQFPGLAIANKVNKEEIELDLDFDNIFTKDEKQGEDKVAEKERRKRSRSRSVDSRD